MKNEFICNQTNCNQSLTTKKNLKDHIINAHNIDVQYYKCDFVGCDHQSKSKSDLKRHVRNVHFVDVIWHECCEPGCDLKFKTESSLKSHITNIHSVEKNIFWYKCDQSNCDEKFKLKGNLKRHKMYVHDINVIWIQCNEIDCTTEFRTESDLIRHKKNVHQNKIATIACTEPGCQVLFKTNEYLKTHLKNIHTKTHNVYLCNISGCKTECKTQTNLDQHKAWIHNIGVVWNICDQSECTFKSKSKVNLKRHIADVHDIGKYQCEYCVKKCAKLIKYKDSLTKKENDICRTCYQKKTGYKTRIEKEIVDWLKKNFDNPIVTSDQRINGNVCLKYRPDIMYNCVLKNLIIYVEIDEHQHLYTNGSYLCDEKRMSDLYDETPGAMVVFIRYNPHKYKLANGYLPVQNNEDRQKLLLNVIKFVSDNSDYLSKDHYMHIFYVCYSPDNQLISQNIPHTLIYSNQDLLKSEDFKLKDTS